MILMERKSIPMGVWTRVPRSCEDANDGKNWIPKQPLKETDQEEESLLNLDSQLTIPIPRTHSADWSHPLTLERLEVGEKDGDKAEYGYVYSDSCFDSFE